MKVVPKILLVITIYFLGFQVKAQSFKKGDFIINANYGQPNLAAYYQKNLYEKRLLSYYDGGDYTNHYSSTGVLSIRSEYAITNKLGLSFGVSLWKYNTSEEFVYREHFMASYGARHSAFNRQQATFQALTLRLNRHFGSCRKIDPCLGFGVGITRIIYKTQAYSLDSGNQVLLSAHTSPADLLPAFALTFGLRYYPLSWFGLNFEAGYDAGALFSGGLVFRYPSSKNKVDTK